MLEQRFQDTREGNWPWSKIYCRLDFFFLLQTSQTLNNLPGNNGRQRENSEWKSEEAYLENAIFIQGR